MARELATLPALKPLGDDSRLQYKLTLSSVESAVESFVSQADAMVFHQTRIEAESLNKLVKLSTRAQAYQT